MRYHSNSDLGKAYEAGYVDGRAAAQAAMPPRELTQAMLDAGSLVFVRKRQDYIPKWEPSIAGDFWRAMYDAWAQEQTSGAASAVTDGPAADPIADLARRLRALRIVDEVHSDNPLGRDAADLIERQAREIAAVQTLLHDTEDRLMQMRAENVALRELLRKVLHATSANMSMDMYAEVCAAIDAERAKVKL